MTRVRDDVLDELVARLGLGALGLYTYLERRVNKHGQCALSYSRIADDTKASRRHIIDLMKVLVDAGYVRVTTPPDTQRTHTPNTFTLPFHPQQKLVQDLHQPSEEASERASAQFAPKVVPSKNQVETPLTPQAESRLAAFRDAYPVHRKSCKPRDLAMLWAALTETEQERALTAIAAWQASDEWTKEDGRFVPKITRYLEEHVWESQPSKPARRAPKYVV